MGCSDTNDSYRAAEDRAARHRRAEDDSRLVEFVCDLFRRGVVPVPPELRAWWRRHREEDAAVEQAERREYERLRAKYGRKPARKRGGL